MEVRRADASASAKPVKQEPDERKPVYREPASPTVEQELEARRTHASASRKTVKREPDELKPVKREPRSPTGELEAPRARALD